jgi:Spx/MgsR family transcriptional regulator
MKKALAWLGEHEVAYEFQDYKKVGVDPVRLAAWARVVGWEALVNRAGTTFRKLPASETADLDEGKALRLLVEHPSMIKRPVLESGGRVIVGFKPEIYASLVR